MQYTWTGGWRDDEKVKINDVNTGGTCLLDAVSTAQVDVADAKVVLAGWLVSERCVTAPDPGLVKVPTEPQKRRQGPLVLPLPRRTRVHSISGYGQRSHILHAPDHSQLHGDRARHSEGATRTPEASGTRLAHAHGRF